MNVKDFNDTLEEYFEKTFESRLVILNLFGRKFGNATIVQLLNDLITNHNS